VEGLLKIICTNPEDFGEGIPVLFWPEHCQASLPLQGMLRVQALACLGSLQALWPSAQAPLPQPPPTPVLRWECRHSHLQSHILLQPGSASLLVCKAFRHQSMLLTALKGLIMQLLKGCTMSAIDYNADSGRLVTRRSKYANLTMG